MVDVALLVEPDPFVDGVSLGRAVLVNPAPDSRGVRADHLRELRPRLHDHTFATSRLALAGGVDPGGGVDLRLIAVLRRVEGAGFDVPVERPGVALVPEMGTDDMDPAEGFLLRDPVLLAEGLLGLLLPLFHLVVGAEKELSDFEGGGEEVSRLVAHRQERLLLVFVCRHSLREATPAAP
jgi:hypothetical protein